MGWSHFMAGMKKDRERQRVEAANRQTLTGDPSCLGSAVPVSSVLLELDELDLLVVFATPSVHVDISTVVDMYLART